MQRSTQMKIRRVDSAQSCPRNWTCNFLCRRQFWLQCQWTAPGNRNQAKLRLPESYFDVFSEDQPYDINVKWIESCWIDFINFWQLTWSEVSEVRVLRSWRKWSTTFTKMFLAGNSFSFISCLAWRQTHLQAFAAFQRTLDNVGLHCIQVLKILIWI